MTRLTLRKGFSLQPVPGGVGHLTDTRTGDALVVPATDYVVLASGGEEGLDSTLPEVAEVLSRYRPFYAEGVPFASFYELDIADAPTAMEIPTIAPVTMPAVRAVEPVTREHPSIPPDLAAAKEAAAAEEPVTKEHAPLPAPEADEEFTQPAGQPELPQPALEAQPTELVSRPEIVTQLAEAAPPVARASRKPLLLTLLAVTLLGVGVGVTWILRPGGEFFPEGPVTPNPTTVVPPAVPLAAVDAGVEEPVVDAGLAEPEIDAGAEVAVIAPEPVIDAGAPEPEVVAEGDGAWLSGEVQSRGRVKMGQVDATASGVVTWTVEEEQRVKAKQVLGTIARETGESSLTAPSVGLVMIKQPSGATVKRGEVLAEIIYFEAWAKGVVKGKTPSTSWRCEVLSAALKKKADCKISVVTPKAGGFQVTVAIEPRWFDEATDAVLRVSPP